MRFGKRDGAAAKDSAGAPQDNPGAPKSGDDAGNDGNDDASSSSDGSDTGDGDGSKESKDSAGAPNGSSEDVVEGPHMVPLAAHSDATSCRVDDREYPIADGRILVEERHVARLLEIGFTFITD